MIMKPPGSDVCRTLMNAMPAAKVPMNALEMHITTASSRITMTGTCASETMNMPITRLTIESVSM